MNKPVDIKGIENIEKNPCKLCEEPTEYIMNIRFKAVPICDDCAN